MNDTITHRLIHALGSDDPKVRQQARQRLEHLFSEITKQHDKVLVTPSYIRTAAMIDVRFVFRKPWHDMPPAQQAQALADIAAHFRYLADRADSERLAIVEQAIP